MKIKLYKGTAASEESIVAFQNFLGGTLSETVKKFLRSFDGAEPESNIFSAGEANESGVNRFIPLRSIPTEISRMRGLSWRAYPIAWAEGGNYVVIDENAQGAVFFWDHELVEPLTKIASDFDSFLDQLMPFDPSSIKLNPSQIKKAWVNPEFLKSLKEK